MSYDTLKTKIEQLIEKAQSGGSGGAKKCTVTYILNDIVQFSQEFDAGVPVVINVTDSYGFIIRPSTFEMTTTNSLTDSGKMKLFPYIAAYEGDPFVQPESLESIAFKLSQILVVLPEGEVTITIYT